MASQDRSSGPLTPVAGEGFGCYRSGGKSMQVALARIALAPELTASHRHVDRAFALSVPETRIACTTACVPPDGPQVQFKRISSFPRQDAADTPASPSLVGSGSPGDTYTRSLSSVRWESAVRVAALSTSPSLNVTVAATTIDGTDNAIPMLSGRIQKSLGSLDMLEGPFVGK